MSNFGRRTAFLAVLLSAIVIGGCGSGTPFSADIAAIAFETTTVPPGGAGQLYNALILFSTEGNAPMPDRFELPQGVLPPGVVLAPDRADNDFDGIPDEDGALTGNARLLGYPRQVGSFTFTIKAIATGANGASSQTAATNAPGDLPALATQQQFTINVGEGSVSILTPTAAEGTQDPQVPAVAEVYSFVNPADPTGFTGFRFQVAGGSGNNEVNIYFAREFELSVFDLPVVNALTDLSHDTDESSTSGDKFLPDFSDGGVFTIQSGTDAQFGGFPSPRGPVGAITKHGPVGGPYTPGLDPAWFQKAPGAGGPAQNSRRNLGDTAGLAGGDTILIPGRTILFSDYFDASYEGTHEGFTDPDPINPPVLTRRKYPFTSDQYANAFFLPFDENVDLTPLRAYAIVEAIDKRNTAAKSDDVIARKAYILQIRIPDIVIDTVALASGQAGVDYVQFVNASGGVPPLSFDLEWVDGTADLSAQPTALDKATFGVEMDQTTGQFFGVPVASGAVDLTVRVYAAVMNPTQNGAAQVPTGNAGEFNGTLTLTGKKGIHKTFTVNFLAPTAPSISNSSLPASVDGSPFPGAQLIGAGGVEKLIPDPIGFTTGYPAGTALRNYEWSASYIRDASHGGAAGTPAPGLPNALILDGDPLSLTNGQISGVTYDRGFHPASFTGRDFYLGSAAAPNLAANRQSFTRAIGISVSPDSAFYLRGVKTTEDANGVPTGLLDETAQIAETRMTPLFLAAGFFKADTGKNPVRDTNLPVAFDILPVALAHGGTDDFIDKSIPAVAGFWPAESSKEQDWSYTATRAWQHLQQEMTWIQLPNHLRLFLFGKTTIKSWTSTTTGGYSKKYQVHDTASSAQRGILMLNPITGEYWMPAILTADATNGTQFGAEVIMQRDNGGYYYYEGVGYWKRYYYAQTDSTFDREVLSQGLGSYIEAYGSNNTGGGWYKTSQGRSGVSVAVSADGKWAATALPGGSEQKILLWKTDKSAIPASITGKSYAIPVTGKDGSGNNLANSAVILNMGGESFSGFSTSTNQRFLFPDSLCFVQDGLIWIDETSLNRILGISLVTGDLSSKLISGGGATVVATRALYPPDQDYLRGDEAQSNFSTQFLFTQSKAAAGETGGSRFAFVAGDNFTVSAFSNDTPAPRDGYLVKGNRSKSLYAMKLTKNAATGLNLSTDTLSDLTGTDSRIYGDLLTPGRMGEDQDYCTMSPDGRFVAVVRDMNLGDYAYYSFYPDWTAYQTFAAISYSGSGTNWMPNDDLLICSVDGEDMDAAAGGTQTVLYIGTNSFTSGAADPSMPTYATGRAYLNATYRRMSGVTFGASTAANQERSVILKYSGDSSYSPKFNAYTSSWAVNPISAGTFSFGTEMSVRINFRTTTGSAVSFNSSSLVTNILAPITSSGLIGSTSAPFTTTTNSTDQCFWTTFKSFNGSFMYYVSDSISNGSHMVGFNITNGAINGRNPYVAYSVHGTTIGLDQIDVNAFTYASRFFSVPGGVVYPPSGRDGGGIVFFIASASSAGRQNSTDLEVYAFDANIGGNAFVLTAAVTDLTANAINHLYVSADGNFLVGQRAKTTSTSQSSRTTLTTNSDLFAVTNVHAALGGAVPNAIRLVSGQSLGSSVAFVGEGTATGPQAVIYSSATTGAQTTWRDRTLKIIVMQTNAVPDVLDTTASHYVVMAGGRKLDDNSATAD